MVSSTLELRENTEKAMGDDTNKTKDQSTGMIDNDGDSDLHTCEIDIAFPTTKQAEQAMAVLQVDQEPTNRVTKSFRLVPQQPSSSVSSPVMRV